MIAMMQRSMHTSRAGAVAACEQVHEHKALETFPAGLSALRTRHSPRFESTLTQSQQRSASPRLRSRHSSIGRRRRALQSRAGPVSSTSRESTALRRARHGRAAGPAARQRQHDPGPSFERARRPGGRKTIGRPSSTGRATEIARASGVGHVTPFHFSGRYRVNADEILKELVDAFRTAEPEARPLE